MRVLDLYCGAGLVHDGLKAAGFEPVGVDIQPQPRYPGPFLKHDALTLDDRLLDMFRFIWASPPCLKDTVLNASARREEVAHDTTPTAHPDLITPTRAMLHRWAARTGGRYVIENVAAAKLLNPVVLCGSMFDLHVIDGDRRWSLERHRKFETNWPLIAPTACHHIKPCVGIYGGHARKRAASAGGRRTADGWEASGHDVMTAAMGLGRYLTCEEISQGIPPVYAQYVGEQLATFIEEQRCAA